jgi:hypothetical protein
MAGLWNAANHQTALDRLRKNAGTAVKEGGFGRVYLPHLSIRFCFLPEMQGLPSWFVKNFIY